MSRACTSKPSIVWRPPSSPAKCHVPRSRSGRSGSAAATSRGSGPRAAVALVRHVADRRRRRSGHRRGRTAGPVCGPSAGGRGGSTPRNAAPSSSVVSRRRPVPASRRATAGRRRERSRRRRVPAEAGELGPGDGVDPRTPQTWTLSGSPLPLLLVAVALADLGEQGPCRADRPSPRRPCPRSPPATWGCAPALQDRPLAEDRARAVLGQPLAVDLDRRTPSRRRNRSAPPIPARR